MAEHDNGYSRPKLTIAAAMLMTGSLGSVHAFSVFVVPLEQLLSASRAQISMLYSFALLFLTASVLLGHRIYVLTTPPRLAALACGGAACGLFVSASSNSFAPIWIGYSLFFGAANGIGYGFSLQLAAQAVPAKKGLAMGAVTAVYAIGATLFAKLLAIAIHGFGTGTAFAYMGVVMLVVALFVFILLRVSGAVYEASAKTNEAETTISNRLLALLWAGYGLGAAAGLMAIAHAAGIVAAAGGNEEQWVLGAMLIGIGNATGGFTAGWFSDRWPIRRLLITLPLLSAVTLIVLSQAPRAEVAIILLCMLGFGYGAIIAVYPCATSEYFGAEAAAKMYGRVFTAWGVAGLAAPWLAGLMYDWSGGYTYALLLAAGAGLLSAGTSLLLD